ncbi:50S ribosomal protein L15 [Thermanaerovibrio acidaminovorans]|jgi:large subunit ribosomal protein L15|uniref:Large ribosomal subunit protein uL15 n=1 Tax=Thermanaerovibrio acidaminovorans (strain ATCC 49978 / DSM 6589 / Su883) TaxID=525903 RepID=D1B5V6_THEAS|nr:50S ribosomal protein L15 [Thermanaerovibrio acidaminovorans]ACZ19397.1 ribosomal protein L15 [Thermanaerovibrio acidaminovorans DSM 6589]
MRLHDLSPVPGSNRKPKRIGFGVGSGHGKTACKGTKGHKSRTGGGVRPGFEGGQMPLVRRIPKRGFSNARHRVVFHGINVGDLNDRFEAGTVVDPAALVAVGLLRRAGVPVKILGDGELTKALTVRAHGFSGSAVKKIEAAGGKTEVI